MSPSTPLPKGYRFLRKGNPYLTSLCRRETLQANKTLYVVKERSGVLGLRAPQWIVAKVFQAERETRAKRKQNVQSRDNSAKREFLAALQQQFPHLPEAEADKVASHAMKKRSGRVGRTGRLSLDTKVRLAAAAHARHAHTDYDERMKRKQRKNTARKAVHADILKVMGVWKGETVKQHNATKRRKSQNTDEANIKRQRRTSLRQKNEEPEVISLLSSSDGESEKQELPPIDWDNLSDWFDSDKDEENTEDEDHDVRGEEDSAEEAEEDLDSVGSAIEQ